MFTLKDKNNQHTATFRTMLFGVVFGLVLSAGVVLGTGRAAANGLTAPLQTTVAATTSYACGTGSMRVYTVIDFGCKGNDCLGGPATVGNSFCGGDHSAVLDILFAIIRFLSAGVGIVVVGSLVFAGIQYTTSRGDPQATAAAIKRIRNTVIAMFIYIFGYAILNYLIPAGFFK